MIDFPINPEKRLDGLGHNGGLGKSRETFMARERVRWTRTTGRFAAVP